MDSLMQLKELRDEFKKEIERNPARKSYMNIEVLDEDIENVENHIKDLKKSCGTVDFITAICDDVNIQDYFSEKLGVRITAQDLKTCFNVDNLLLKLSTPKSNVTLQEVKPQHTPTSNLFSLNAGGMLGSGNTSSDTHNIRYERATKRFVVYNPSAVKSEDEVKPPNMFTLSDGLDLKTFNDKLTRLGITAISLYKFPSRTQIDSEDVESVTMFSPSGVNLVSHLKADVTYRAKYSSMLKLLKMFFSVLQALGYGGEVLESLRQQTFNLNGEHHSFFDRLTIGKPIKSSGRTSVKLVAINRGTSDEVCATYTYDKSGNFCSRLDTYRIMGNVLGFISENCGLDFDELASHVLFIGHNDTVFSHFISPLATKLFPSQIADVDAEEVPFTATDKNIQEYKNGEITLPTLLERNAVPECADKLSFIDFNYSTEGRNYVNYDINDEQFIQGLNGKCKVRSIRLTYKGVELILTPYEVNFFRVGELVFSVMEGLMHLGVSYQRITLSNVALLSTQCESDVPTKGGHLCLANNKYYVVRNITGWDTVKLSYKRLFTCIEDLKIELEFK